MTVNGPVDAGDLGVIRIGAVDRRRRRRVVVFLFFAAAERRDAGARAHRDPDRAREEHDHDERDAAADRRAPERALAVARVVIDKGGEFFHVQKSFTVTAAICYLLSTIYYRRFTIGKGCKEWELIKFLLVFTNDH